MISDRTIDEIQKAVRTQTILVNGVQYVDGNQGPDGLAQQRHVAFAKSPHCLSAGDGVNDAATFMYATAASGRLDFAGAATPRSQIRRRLSSERRAIDQSNE